MAIKGEKLEKWSKQIFFGGMICCDKFNQSNCRKVEFRSELFYPWLYWVQIILRKNWKVFLKGNEWKKNYDIFNSTDESQNQEEKS